MVKDFLFIEKNNSSQGDGQHNSSQSDGMLKALVSCVSFGTNSDRCSRATSTTSPAFCVTTLSASLTKLTSSYISHMIAATMHAEEN